MLQGVLQCCTGNIGHGKAMQVTKVLEGKAAAGSDILSHLYCQNEWQRQVWGKSCLQICSMQPYMYYMHYVQC